MERRILDEMGAGVRVYYDRRWEATEIFGNWVLDHRTWIEGKRVLVLGAGVGLETVVLGRHCKKLYINDLAPVALDLCREQLARNGIVQVESLPGPLENLILPKVDLVVACFLVYNRETRTAINTFVQKWPVPLLLVNESLGSFQRLLVDLTGRWEELFLQDAARGVLVS